MIKTGKRLEEIILMLNDFKTQVQAFSALGLLNINKHSENFMKRVLNLIYNYELENLNKGKSNYPGLDLGNSSEGIAFHITSTKKSEKIDDTLKTCLKFEHYKTFKSINIFILTNKQSSYTIKTITEPYFSFSPEHNIKDFNDLFKDIEHLNPTTMEALHDYIKSELQPVIESIRDNESKVESCLIDITEGLQESGMPNYFVWKSNISLKTEKISVPTIYSQLNSFLSKAALKSQYLPILNDALRKTQSNKKVLYYNQIQRTHIQNYCTGNAMLLEPSAITIEKVDYTSEAILSNLLSEMLMLLTCVLFFSKQAKGNFEIVISIWMETNGVVHFHPTRSLVLEKMVSSFTLDSPFSMTETLTNVHNSTLADLLQQIMYGFIAQEPSFLNNEPFININRDSTEFVINNIKKELGISDIIIF